MSLTDSRRMWKITHGRGCEGLHSHDARRLGISGNPSQRAKDIADHVPFWTRREARNGRPGSRYWVDGFQPSDAVAVRPNGPESGDGDAVAAGNERAIADAAQQAVSTPPESSGSPVAALRVEAASEQVGVKEPVALVRDYDRDPYGPWREVPVSQLGWAA